MGRAFVDPSKHRPDRVRLRPIVDADMPFLRALYASTREAELAPVPWPPETKHTFLNQQFDAQHAYYRQVYGDGDFLLVLRDEAPIGRIYLHRTSVELSVVDIALLPEFCGQGIGSALFAELFDEARETSREVTLHVEPNNPAQRLYARLGFRLAERLGMYDYFVWNPAGGSSSAA